MCPRHVSQNVSQTCVTGICPRHVLQTCVPGMCRRHVSQACVADMCPRHVSQACGPDMCPMHMSQACVPDMCLRHVSQTCVPGMCPRHVSQTCVPDMCQTINGILWKSDRIQAYQCNMSYKVKLKEWGVNLLLSDYEADMLTIWLKAQTASQVASSLPILTGILHFSLRIWKTVASQS